MAESDSGRGELRAGKLVLICRFLLSMLSPDDVFSKAQLSIKIYRG